MGESLRAQSVLVLRAQAPVWVGGGGSGLSFGDVGGSGFSLWGCGGLRAQLGGGFNVCSSLPRESFNNRNVFSFRCNEYKFS